MTEQTVPLAVVYQGWADFQRSLLKDITPLTPKQWALPLAAHHWPIGMVAQHLVANRAWWFHVWMGEGDPDMLPLVHWDDPEATLRPAAKVVPALEATWSMIEATLARWTVADLGQVFNPPATLTDAERQIFGPSTRQEIMMHVLWHDYHHGGELSLGMGGYHLPTD